MEKVSTTVVINGDAIMAGSKCSFFAAKGKMHPTSLEAITVQIKEAAITKANFGFLYWIQIRNPLDTAKAAPTIKEMRNSLNITRKMSEKCISSTAMPRMIKVELCEPQFPPVSISMGIKDTKSGIVAKAFSYLLIMLPVIIEVNIKTKSHGIRLAA